MFYMDIFDDCSLRKNTHAKETHGRFSEFEDSFRKILLL